MVPAVRGRSWAVAVAVVVLLLLGLGWVLGVSTTRSRPPVTRTVEVRCAEVATRETARCVPPSNVRRVLGTWYSGAIASLARDDFGRWRLEVAPDLSVTFPWSWEELSDER